MHTGNQTNMDVRGFNLAGGMSAAAEGSAELGHALKRLAHDIEAHYHLKFCTAHYKDAGQLRHRFKRRATIAMRPYEVLSEDDTLLFGAIHPAEHTESDLADARGLGPRRALGALGRDAPAPRSAVRGGSHRGPDGSPGHGGGSSPDA